MKPLPRLLLAALPLSLLLAVTGQAQEGEGESVYQARCAACHANPNPETDAHTPSREDMARFTANSVYAAMTDGLMRIQAQGLTDAQMRSVATYLTGSEVSDVALEISENLCRDNPPLGQPALAPEWNGWGPGVRNTRFQNVDDGGLRAADLPRLKLKWAYGLPGEGQPRAQPLIAAGRLYVGNRAGALYSVNAESGCTYWSYLPRSGLRSAISIGPIRLADGSEGQALYFVDIQANAYAVNAHTGEQIWVRRVEDHPGIRGTGALTLHDGRVYVPMTGVGEENTASGPNYPCCTFRGSISALDANTGDQLWKYYTVPEPQPRGTNANGETLYGPAGVGIWSAPTIDEVRGLLYAATGNAYAEPAPETSDAVIALDLDSGELVWVNQLLPNDAWIGGCNPDTPNPNCPEEQGPDFDFSASPMLTSTASGRELLVVPQKSGMAYALDPNDGGKLVWEYRWGAGSPVGGIWGMAAGEGRGYVAVGGYFREDSGGIHAIDLDSGEQLWFTGPQEPICEPGPGCSATQSAAVTAIPGAVFSGAADGGLRAYAAENGEVLWTFDANQDFETVNGVPANGASFDGSGPVVAGGMLYILSGNAGFVGRPGNVLLAFALEEEAGGE